MALWNASDFAKTRWSERNVDAVYVAKHGNDRNDGHPARPVASLNHAVSLASYSYYTNQVVIASGVYTESIYPAPGVVITGDGFVVLDGIGLDRFCNCNGNYTLNRCTVQNYNQLQGPNASGAFNNCILRNFNFLVYSGDVNQGLNLSNVLVVDAPKLGVYSPYLYLSLVNSTLINSGLDLGGNFASVSIRNTFADENSRLPYRPDKPCAYYNNNILGTIAGQRLADFGSANPTALKDCVVLAPGFNNALAGDYTLAVTSQMRNLASDGGFVGAYGIGINFAGLPDADAVTNIVWNSTLGAFVLQNQQQPGSVEFVVKDFMRNWILEESLLVGQEDNIDNQTIDATLSYDVDSVGAPANVQSGGLDTGRVFWVNGYDTVTYKGQQYTQGQFFACTDDLTYVATGMGKVVRLNEAPNIRLYELKYSSQSAVDCVSRPWQYFQFNKVPTVDAAGRSNGDPLFNPATANPITVRYVKSRLSLMPNSLA